MRKAEERARAMIAQEEIVKQAQEKAKEIITQAQTMAKELKKAANEFSDNALKHVHETRQELNAAMKKGSFVEQPANDAVKQ